MLARHKLTTTVVKLRSDRSISEALNEYQEYVNRRLTVALRALAFAHEANPDVKYRGQDNDIKEIKIEREQPADYHDRRRVAMNAILQFEADKQMGSDTVRRRNMLADETLRLWAIGERSNRSAFAPARFNHSSIALLSAEKLRVSLPCRKYVLSIHPIPGIMSSTISGWLCRDQAGHYLELTSNAFAEPVEIPEELPNSLWSGPNELWFQNLPPRTQSRLNRLYTDYLRHSMDATNHHDIDAKRAQRQRAKCQVIETEIRSITSEFNCPAPFVLGE